MACWFEWNTKGIYLIGRCQCIDISRVSCPLYRYVELLCIDFNSIGFNLNFFVSIIWRHFVEIRWKKYFKKIKLILIWLFFFFAGRLIGWWTDRVDHKLAETVNNGIFLLDYFVWNWISFRGKCHQVEIQCSARGWGAWIDFVPITKVTQRTVYFSMNFLKMNYFWINFE